MLRLILGQPPTIHMHAQMFQTWLKSCIRALSFCKWLKWRLLVLATGDTYRSTSPLKVVGERSTVTPLTIVDDFDVMAVQM